MSLDAEAAVLGAVICNSDAYWRAADLLTPEDFANGTCRRVWTLIGDMLREGSTVDVVTLAEREPGMQRAIFDLAQTAGAIANTRAYAEVVAKRAVERRVIAAGQRIAGLRGDDILGEAQRILAACLPRQMQGVRHAKDILRELVTDLSAKYDAGEALTGLPTGLPWLDDVTGGLQRSDLVIVAARPSVGKTALATQIILHAASKKTPTLFFSAEMSCTQVMARAVSHIGGVSLKAIRSPVTLGDEGWAGLTRAGGEVQDYPWWVDDSAGQTVDAISARARQLDSQQRLGLIVVDYLQHLKLPKAERHDLSIGEASKALKGLAKQLNVPVILVSQLNRDGANSRPTLSTLRGSGDIEQDADVVMFLHRPDDMRRDQLELIVAKQRNGECGECWLHFDGAKQRFTESEAPSAPEPKQRSGFRAIGFGSARDRAAGNGA
jgi:replicative DNA helicase